MEDRRLLLMKLSSVYAALAVIAGAFGAHALKDRLEPQHLATFTTASHYLLSISVASLAVLAAFPMSSRTNRTAMFLLGGVTIFSGSLFLLVATGIKTFGAITPIGGTAIIVALLSLGFAKHSK